MATVPPRLSACERRDYHAWPTGAKVIAASSNVGGRFVVVAAPLGADIGGRARARLDVPRADEHLDIPSGPATWSVSKSRRPEPVRDRVAGRGGYPLTTKRFVADHSAAEERRGGERPRTLGGMCSAKSARHGGVCGVAAVRDPNR